ncbi:MAG: TSUP family transporter [Acidobacteria bacterium]|nr:TSUP family transporter [Acidobacteriota bacterium]
MMAWLQGSLLFLAGTGAGFVDSIAGGGGLITVPVLLGVGLPPADALGTNKFQSSFGSGSAVWHFHRAGIFSVRRCALGVFMTAVGAAGGAWAVQHLPPDLLRRAIPFLLMAVAAYILCAPRLGELERRPHLVPALFFTVFGLTLGFYDGFFGPGTGSFWVMALMLLAGRAMTVATAETKLMNFTSNIVSLAVFIAGGHVQWVYGLVMGVGEVIGARLGSGLVLRRGSRVVRPTLVLISLAVTAKLLLDR